MRHIPFSIIIPAYNEAESVKQVVLGLQNLIRQEELKGEIIVVDDSSIDETAQVASSLGVKVINHPVNRGYGAALKTGIKQAKYDWLLFFDADGQFKPEFITKALNQVDRAEAIIGTRRGYQGPIGRLPGKKLIKWVANYLAQTKIPDINCGFRLIKKKILLNYLPLLPDGYSFSTTLLLALIKAGVSIYYLPIQTNKRASGRSSLRLRDGFNTLLLIIRLIMLFAPLRVFLPASFLFLMLAILAVVFETLTNGFNISDSALLFLITSILMFFFGLLADQLAALRREINLKR